MDLATLLVLNAIAFLLLLLWLRRRVDRELSAERALERIRHEVGDLLKDLNATTERNITLIEDRVTKLRTLVEQADRKIGVLRKESEKHDVGRSVYNDLLERRRQAARAEHEGYGLTPTDNSSEADTSIGSPEYNAPARDDRQESRSSRTESGTGSRSEKEEASQERVSGRSLRNRVRDLHHAGFAAGTIAKKVGSTIGEVELIIGLEGGIEGQGHGNEDGEQGT